MTVKDLYEKVVNGIIISDIELQRAIVYDKDKQALVIDSIYHDIPLPAFYLWQREDGKLEVLDGKQRIEAIKKFIEEKQQTTFIRIDDMFKDCDFQMDGWVKNSQDKKK